MISEFEVLTVLSQVRASCDRLGPDEIRAGAIIASLFTASVVRHDSVLGAIDTLRRKGLLEPPGEDFGLTVEGRALVSALGPTLIGQARLETLGKLGESLHESGTAAGFIRAYGPRVTELAGTRRASLIENAGPAILCAFVFRVDGIPALRVSRFKIPLTLSDFNWSSVRRLERSLQSDAVRPGLVSVRGDTLVVVATTQIEKLSLQDHPLDFVGSTLLNEDEVRYFSGRVVEGFVREAFLRDGYSAVGAGWRIYVDLRTPEAGPVPPSSRHAFRTYPQLLPDSRVLLWVEEYNKPWITALELIDEVGEEASEALRRSSLHALPSERVVKFVELRRPTDIDSERVPGLSASFRDYWAELGFDLEERLQPIIVVESKFGVLHYPAETVLVGGSLARKAEDWEPRVLTPGERIASLRRIRDEVFGAVRPSLDGVEIVLEQMAPTERETQVLGFPVVKSAKEPVLRFAKGATSVDPLDVFDYGPEAGRKAISIRNVYYPASSKEGECKGAVQALCAHYSRCGFGEARLDPAAVSTSYIEPSAGQAIGELVRRTAKVYGPGTTGIAVLDEEDSTYFAFKRYYPEYARAPIQAIQARTVGQILAGKRGLLDQLALNLYLKQLGPRESVWSLLTPAGGSAGTAFVAIAFSRALNPQRGGRGVAVLHDASGRGLSWESLVTPGERTISQDWFEKVIEQILPMLHREPASRLVFYRAGRLDSVEVSAIEAALSRKMTSGTEVDFVCVFNEHRRFFATAEGVVANPPPGTAIIWSESEALLAESGFEDRGVSKGSVVPVSLKRALGRTPIEKLVAEYHDLTHLSWSAPYTTWKHPLVMRIADRLAEIGREGGISVGPKFLPL